MAIIWTKDWSAADDGTVLKAIDLKNIQDDINTTGLADADAIQGVPVDAPTAGNDGQALIYDDGSGTFTYSTAVTGNVVGQIVAYGGSSAPSGWALCDGSAISRTTFADLFAALGTTFGVGDGSTTFNIPDLRGRFPLGKDNMGGSSANRVTDAQADTLGGSSGAETKNIEHTHPGGTTGGPSSTVFVDDNSGGTDYNVGSETHTHTTTSTGNGGSTTQDVMNPYLTLNYIIKTT
jgi:microcystin-dependent protein